MLILILGPSECADNVHSYISTLQQATLESERMNF
jgi:hypothetical protein